MDAALQELIEQAARRGNRYIRGEATAAGLPGKVAELGVYLLEEAKRLSTLDEAKVREELIEIQNKLDDLRKTIFINKIGLKP